MTIQLRSRGIWTNHYLRSQSLFKRPSFIKSLVYSMSRNSGTFGPFSYTKFHTIKLKYSVLTVISVLLSLCGPSTITRFISFTIVDTVNCVFRGRLHAHILDKEGKGFKPSFTDWYIGVFNMTFIWVKASCLHRGIATILRCKYHPMSFYKLTFIIPHSVNINNFV